jgi:hypothetical protein
MAVCSRHKPAFSGLRNSQVAADFPRQKLVDFTVSRDRRRLVIRRVHVDTMLAAVPQQTASVRFDVPD